MSITKVVIEEVPFEEILRSAYETLSVEGGGFLFGRIENQNDSLLYIVQSAHPIQLAKRTPSYIEGETSRASWPGLRTQIGGYHTHPRGRAQNNGERFIENGKLKLSPLDKRNLKSDREEIEIIIALKKAAGRKYQFSNNDPFVIKGYINGEKNSYPFEMGAYVHNGRLRRCQLHVAPTILKQFQ